MPALQLGAIVTPQAGQEAHYLAACKRAGFGAVQINLSSRPTPEFVGACISGCKTEGLELAAWGVYGNPLSPSTPTEFGVSGDDVGELLGLLPGRREDEGPWIVVCYSGTVAGQLATPHPGNTMPGASAEVGVWTESQLLALESHNAVLAFKNHFAHVLSDAVRMKDFFAARGNPAIGIAFDPCNLLTPRNFQERENLINEAIKMLAPYTALVHLKDARIEHFKIQTSGPGQGQLGMAGLLKILWRYSRDVLWLIDGVDNELQLKRSREFVELQAKLAGIV
jgi:sugar phosphate isomerase/epimerase